MKTCSLSEEDRLSTSTQNGGVFRCPLNVLTAPTLEVYHLGTLLFKEVGGHLLICEGLQEWLFRFAECCGKLLGQTFDF